MTMKYIQCKLLAFKKIIPETETVVKKDFSSVSF